MENRIDEPQSSAALPTIRHDGWTGEKMATFCETLAETAIVAEACDAAHMGISGAYAARRRNPVFAAAWDAALSIARERLADTLLARSMEGNVEQIWRDGVIVGERHVLDNRLGLAILRRLDRLAETGMAVSTIGQRMTLKYEPRPTPACNPQAIDWTFAIDALRTGDDEGVAKALALVKSYEVEEVEGPLNPSSDDDDEEESFDLSHRCWRDGIDGDWRTDFPPPAGFTGYESRPYDDTEDDERYVRVCSPEEIAILDADAARARAGEREEDGELRDAWFELLRADCIEAGLPAPAPAASPPSSQAPGQQADHQQQDDRPDGRIDDCADDAGAEMRPNPRQQPVADERADDADQEVAENSETHSADDLARDPAGDDADDQDDQHALIGQMHRSPPRPRGGS
jgi:hypothetical protein